MPPPRLTPEEVESPAALLAMAPHLLADEVRRLLDEHRLLLLGRRELEELLAELEPPLRSVRAVLNRLHHVLYAHRTATHRS